MAGSRKKRWIIRSVLVLVVLTVVALALWFEAVYSGEKEWERYAEEARGNGVELTSEEFVRTVDNADQVSANSPLWIRILSDPENARETIPKLPKPEKAQKTKYADLAQWRAAFIRDKWLAKTDTEGSDAEAILRGLQKMQRDLDDFRAIRDRPLPHLPDFWREPYPSKLSHFSAIMILAKAFRLKAVAHLRLSQPTEAAEIWKDAMALARAPDATPCEISSLVAVSIEYMMLEVLDEGLASHQWTDAQLAGFAQILASRNVLLRYQWNLAADRALFNTGMEPYLAKRDLGPLMGGGPNGNIVARLREANSGWWRRNQVRFNQAIDRRSAEIELIDGKVRTLAFVEDRPVQLKPGEDESWYVFAVITGSSSASIRMKIVMMHALFGMGEIACALERSWLASGKYPATLAEVPQGYLQVWPVDPCTGEAFQYRVQDDGTFLLYSLGANGRDDGGQGGIQDSLAKERPDWPWGIPPAR